MGTRLNYWAKPPGPEGHRYLIQPLENGQSKTVEEKDWENVYETLGELGYLFRYSGHNKEDIIISLNKPINQEHLKQLEDAFQIQSED